MGYCVPAAMGVKVANPDSVVWAIDGDGCFQMTNQELATCAIEGIPIKVAVINNGNLGMVRQWQTLFYEERYSNTELGTHKHRVPDFVLLAQALGCEGLRCESRDDVDRVLYLANGSFRIGTPDEVLRTDVLSELYGTRVDVVSVRGKTVIV